MKQEKWMRQACTFAGTATHAFMVSLALAFGWFPVNAAQQCAVGFMFLLLAIVSMLVAVFCFERKR